VVHLQRQVRGKELLKNMGESRKEREMILKLYAPDYEGGSTSDDSEISNLSSERGRERGNPEDKRGTIENQTKWFGRTPQKIDPRGRKEIHR